MATSPLDTQNLATTTQALSAPATSFPAAQNGYSAVPNGTGGVNYFNTNPGINGGQPVATTRELYQSAGYGDPAAVEAQALAAYQASQPTSSLGTSGTTTGGTTGGTGTTGPTAAQIAGITASNQGIKDLAASNTSNAADQLYNGPNGIVDTIKSLGLGQNAVDQGRIQDQLARTQGLNGVLHMVNRGISSGGIQLANSGASNSSAAEALARAYGLQGRDAASQVGTQFGIDENKQNQAQTAQDAAAEEGVNHINAAKSNAINSIVGDALSRLTALSTMAGSMGVTGQVDVEGEKQSILQNAMNALSQYDTQIAGAKPNAMSPDAIAAQANTLATQGTAAAAPYNYTTTGPAQFQNTGPSASELPIYVSPTAKKTI